MDSYVNDMMIRVMCEEHNDVLDHLFKWVN